MQPSPYYFGLLLSLSSDDTLAWYIRQSVMRLRCAKTAELIEVVLGTKTFSAHKTSVMQIPIFSA